MKPASIVYSVKKAFIQLGLWKFIVAWSASRQQLKFLWNIPVILTIAAVVNLSYLAARDVQSSYAPQLLSAANSAMNAGENARARLLFRKASQSGSQYSSAQLGLAKLAEKEGDIQQATRIMVKLAEQSDDTAATANLWLVQKLLSAPKDKQSIVQPEIIERLERTVRIRPAELEPRLLLSDIYASTGQVESATFHLKAVAAAHPNLYLKIAQLYRVTGRQDLARSSALTAAEYFKKRVLLRPDDESSRISYAISLALLEEYAEGVEILQHGMALNPSAELKSQLVNLYLAWAGALESRKEFGQALELLQLALQTDSQNPRALALLFRLAEQSSAHGAKAKAELRDRLAQGDSPALIHLLLGTTAFQEGKVEEAQDHLERALSLNPGSVVVLNNLAMILATKLNPDLDRALSYTDQAILVAPDVPQLRDTRAQIFIAKGNWKKALTELELALPAYTRQQQLASELPKLHRSLALVYEKLGDAEMAKRHQKLAEKEQSEDLRNKK